MQLQKITTGIKSISTYPNRGEDGFVASKPWEISTANLHKNIIKVPV